VSAALETRTAAGTSRRALLDGSATPGAADGLRLADRIMLNAEALALVLDLGELITPSVLRGLVADLRADAAEAERLAAARGAGP